MTSAPKGNGVAFETLECRGCSDNCPSNVVNGMFRDGDILLVSFLQVMTVCDVIITGSFLSLFPLENYQIGNSSFISTHF